MLGLLFSREMKQLQRDLDTRTDQCQRAVKSYQEMFFIVRDLQWKLDLAEEQVILLNKKLEYLTTDEVAL